MYAQVRMICERMLREQEMALRTEYETVLNSRLAEQYEAFVRFNIDQVQRRPPLAACAPLGTDDHMHQDLVPSCMYTFHYVFFCWSYLNQFLRPHVEVEGRYSSSPFLYLGLPAVHRGRQTLLIFHHSMIMTPGQCFLLSRVFIHSHYCAYCGYL